MRPPKAPPRTLASSAILAGIPLVAWMLVSDDWDGILNDGNAVTALSLTAGILMAAALLALIALTNAATRRRRRGTALTWARARSRAR